MVLDHDDLHRAIEHLIVLTERQVLPAVKPGRDIPASLFLVNEAGKLGHVSPLDRLVSATLDPAQAARQIEEAVRNSGAPGYIILMMGAAEGSETPDMMMLTAGSVFATASRVYRVVRDQEGRPAGLTEEEAWRDGDSGGPFSDLLRYRGPLH